MNRGRLIVLEGGEGAGKSTHALTIRDWLQDRGRRVVLTREPGGTVLAEAIRRVVLDSAAVPPLTELLLMFAARASHVQELIQPALARGADVVCDRFVDASYAYQGAGRGLPLAQIRALERMVLGRLRPDQVLLLDLTPRQGAARIRARPGANRFDAERLDFQERVRAAYLRRARDAPSRYAVVNAGRSLAAVRRDILQVLERRL